MLTIGNVYGHGFGKPELERLEELGFSLRPGVGSYAGSQILRFLDFSDGPTLELIEVENEDEYRGFLPAGMEPYCPGIALALGEEDLIGDYEHRFARLEPYRLHFNYDGSPDPGKPGVTYLNFAEPVVRGAFTWLEALDEPIPAQGRVRAHSNRAVRVLGLVFDLELAALGDLAELTGAEKKGDALSIGAQTIWPKAALAGLPGEREKRFPLNVIVVETESLDAVATAPGVSETTFLTRRAALIETSPLCWDIVLVAAD